jgi:hypothetical protein
MAEHDYRISALANKFAAHAEEFAEDYKKRKGMFPENDCLGEGFNVSQALSVMCWEIEKLKHLVGNKDQTMGIKDSLPDSEWRIKSSGAKSFSKNMV